MKTKYFEEGYFCFCILHIRVLDKAVIYPSIQLASLRHLKCFSLHFLPMALSCPATTSVPICLFGLPDHRLNTLV